MNTNETSQLLESIERIVEKESRHTAELVKVELDHLRRDISRLEASGREAELRVVGRLSQVEAAFNQRCEALELRLDSLENRERGLIYKLGGLSVTTAGLVVAAIEAVKQIR